MQCTDNIEKWTKAPGRNISMTEDRTGWHERSCAAGAGNVKTDDAD